MVSSVFDRGAGGAGIGFSLAAADDGTFIVGDGTAFVGESGATARASLGLVIGTDVQAFHANLADVAAVTQTKGDVLVSDGTDFVDVAVGTNGQVFIADSTQSSGVKWGTTDSIAKAWNVFDGTGTIAIDDSFNVTSITDNAVGDYTTTWDIDFLLPHYACVVIAMDDSVVRLRSDIVGGASLAGSIRTQHDAANSTLTDSPQVNIVAFGDQ